MPRKGVSRSIEAALAKVMVEARNGLNTDVKNKLETIVKDNASSYRVGRRIEEGVKSYTGKSRITIEVPLNLGHTSMFGSKKYGIEKGKEAVGLPYWMDKGHIPTLDSIFGRYFDGTPLEYRPAKPFWTESVNTIKGESISSKTLASYLEEQGFKVFK